MEDTSRQEENAAEQREEYKGIDLSECDQETADILRSNLKCLYEFEEDLLEVGLKDSTIHHHLANTDLFLNDWLAFHEGCEMDDGLHEIDKFLGSWFIRRCMWSTPASMKTTAASLKKFYKSMAVHNHISEADHKKFVSDVRAQIPEWQRLCILYNDPRLP